MARQIEEKKKLQAGKSKFIEEEKEPVKPKQKKIIEEVKKPFKKRNPLEEVSEDERVEAESPEEKARKLAEQIDRIKQNEEPVRIWTRRIKITACILFLLWTAFMNGAFSSLGHAPAEVDRMDREAYSNDLFSMTHVWIALRESWFLFVAFGAYLGLKAYNDYLDKEEQKLVEVKEKEE